MIFENFGEVTLRTVYIQTATFMPFTFHDSNQSTAIACRHFITVEETRIF